MSPPDLLTTHEGADPDGLGALVALSLLHPGSRVLLPAGLDPLARALHAAAPGALPRLHSEADLAGLLEACAGGALRVADTARPGRIGALAQHLDRFAEVWAYDTHPPQPDDLPRAPLPAAASATAGLVLRLVDAALRPTPAQAGMMLVGVHVDSGDFRYPSTTAADHEAAAACLRWGADPTWARAYGPREPGREALRRLGRMADAAEVLDLCGRAVAFIPFEEPDGVQELSPLLTRLREAEGWPAAFLLASMPGRVQIIGRSDGTVDCGGALAALGGGGHREAASASRSDLGLTDAKGLLVHILREQLGEVGRAADQMVTAMVTAPAGQPLSAVAALLHRHHINALPLHEDGPEGRRWTGQVSRQEVDAALRHGMADVPARAISARPPGWLRADAPLGAVREALLSGHGRIWMVGHPDPSAPEGGALGLLTRTSVLRAAADAPLRAGARGPHASVVKGLLRRSLGPRMAELERIGALAAELGCPAWLVGGGARDVLLGAPARDIDLVVEGSAAAVATEAARRFGGKALAHEAFGTAKWAPPDGADPIDLAGARGEAYAAPGRLPDVHHAELRQDLFRRDFTLNALAISVRPDQLGALVDPYGGWADLQDRVLRVLHGLSFLDDPTRAFRAARFAARFDLRLAGGTRGLLDGAVGVGAFGRVGVERIGHELERIFAESTADRALALLRDWGVLAAALPGLKVDAGLLQALDAARDGATEARGLLPAGQAPSPADCAWIALGTGFAPEARPRLQRLVPGDLRRQRRFVEGPERVLGALGKLGHVRRPSYAGRTLAALDDVERAAALGLARAMPHQDEARAWLRWWWQEGAAARTAVDGAWLHAQGVAPGPVYKTALTRAQDACWDGEDAEGQRAAAWAVARAADAGPPGG